MREDAAYPFSALVSLENMKLALLLNAVNPKIGGVLIRGPKGSGKTTAVRALADLLPAIKVVKDCTFNDSPEDPSNMCQKCSAAYTKNGALDYETRKMRVVDLPLGATEDRVIGSLDVEKALKMGVEALEPGILAEANQNILYIDEVNLLPDHIADDLLDAAASGWNIVEREGISVKHPSRFIFIGTMNPEEGQLRPQLLDRFPLSVEAERISDVKQRAEIVKRNIEFETDPQKFADKQGSQQEQMRSRILQARKMLDSVKISDRLVEVISGTCLELKVDGIRPDIVIAKTAKTIAALENQAEVTPEHILKASELTLNHRTREGGFLEPATPEEIRDALDAKLKEAGATGEQKTRVLEKAKGKDYKGQSSGEEKKKIFPPFGLRKVTNKEKDMARAKPGKEHNPSRSLLRDSNLARGNFLFNSKSQKGGRSGMPMEYRSPKLTSGTPFMDRIRASRLLPFRYLFRVKKASGRMTSNVGKRAEAVTSTHRGRAVGWGFPDGRPSDVHFPATIRAAARMQRSRPKPAFMAVSVRSEDVREKVRVYRAPMTIVFVLDLSESMLSFVEDVKEAMLKLHSDAYRHRDRVGIVAFKETGAVVVQHPTSNLKLVTSKLSRLRMSGFTPLASGMLKALEVLKDARQRDPSTIPVEVVITDGDANMPLRRDLLTGEIREFDLLDAAFFKYEDEAVTDVLSVSKLMRKERINTVVVNTTFPSVGQKGDHGSETAQMIASITGGIYHETFIGHAAEGGDSSRQISMAILEAQRQILHSRHLATRAG